MRRPFFSCASIERRRHTPMLAKGAACATLQFKCLFKLRYAPSAHGVSKPRSRLSLERRLATIWQMSSSREPALSTCGSSYGALLAMLLTRAMQVGDSHACSQIQPATRQGLPNLPVGGVGED